MKIPLHYRILIGMLLGLVAGVLIRHIGLSEDQIAIIIKWVKLIGDLFLRLLFMMVIPLIFCALVLGVGELGDLKNLGRIGIKTLLYTLLVSSIAVFIGIGMVGWLQPGVKISEEERSRLISQYSDKLESVKKNMEEGEQKSFPDLLLNIVPRNPMEDVVFAFNTKPTAKDVYDGSGVMAIMFFALMIGVAMISSSGPKIDAFRHFIEGSYELIMKVISMVMNLAPFGVAALLFVLVAGTGSSVMLALGKYMLVVIVGLAIHQFVVYPLILKFWGKMSPVYFFRNISEVMLTAFSTSSSNASLPTALKAAQENLKLPPHISHFVLTVGSTANQNGTALFEGVTVLFLAQCFRIDLNLSQQISVVVACILAGIGTAGVPGGSLPVVAIILTSVGIPAEAIGIIIGVDRILDMCRTTLNVSGDLTAAVVVSRWENKGKTQ